MDSELQRLAFFGGSQKKKMSVNTLLIPLKTICCWKIVVDECHFQRAGLCCCCYIFLACVREKKLEWTSFIMRASHVSQLSPRSSFSDCSACRCFTPWHPEHERLMFEERWFQTRCCQANCRPTKQLNARTLPSVPYLLFSGWKKKRSRSSNPFSCSLKPESGERSQRRRLDNWILANLGSWESLSAPQHGREDLRSSPNSLCVRLNVALKEPKRSFKLYKRNKCVTGALAARSGKVALGFENPKI